MFPKALLRLGFTRLMVLAFFRVVPLRCIGHRYTIDNYSLVGYPRHSTDMSKRWCITVFDEDIIEEPGSLWDEDEMNFYVVQIEVCPKTGKHHLQGYIEYKTRKRFDYVKKRLPGAHLETAKGSPDDNVEYCTKTSSRVLGPWTYGSPAPWEQGKRSDLADAYEIIKEGGSIVDIAEFSPAVAIRYGRGCETLISHLDEPRRWQTQGIVYWGVSGGGKSHKAWSENPDAYDKDDTKWWTGYNGQDVVIWDDFDPTQIRLSFLLKLLDKYPMRVETKGGYVQMKATKVIFTSNFDPVTWYNDVAGALKRRLITHKMCNKWGVILGPPLPTQRILNMPDYGPVEAAIDSIPEDNIEITDD